MLMDHLFLISIAVLTLVVVFVLGMVLYFAARRAHAKPSSDPKVARLRFDSLRSSFRQAVELVEGNIANRANRYSVPWVMVLSEGEHHRQLPIAQSGVASALSVESASAAATQGISWSFFDRGIVIDIQGAYLGSPDDEDAAEKPWDEFLGLCRAYRPQRPFDSVVITIPAALLLSDSPDSRLEISRRAKLAHRRLWLAQNRFAMRFAVYVVVTDAEEIEGFSAFARGLPEPLRASMLGWSSPYDLATTYQSSWVDEAMSSMVRSVSDVGAEQLTINAVPLDAGVQLLLPARIQTMHAQLRLYVDELMRPSAYHEPFFFRGIYLTGDSSESAQAVVAMQAASDTTGYGPGYGAEGGHGEDLIAQLMLQPVFLRDLFEKKIFVEYGLTRPSRTHSLSQPVLHRGLRWAGVVFVGGWALGLAYATWQLNQDNKSLVAALHQLHGDTQYRAGLLRRGEDVSPAWYRAKALALLEMSERLRTDGTRSLFMPGSWPLFDDLNEGVMQRIEREFGDIAVNTLRRELTRHAARLSGVEQDSSTGALVIGAQCTAPPSFAAVAELARKGGMQLEDQPEFAALQRYLSEVDQLDAALLAAERLWHPSTSNAQDLRLVVRYTLGAELPADIRPSLRHFHQAATDSRGLGVPITPIQAALRCALAQGAGQLDARLFSHNELLLSEEKLQRQSSALAHGGEHFSEVLAAYRETIAAIKVQEDVITAGKGSWMRQPDLALGPAYERAMSRIALNRLLGQDSAEQMRQRALDAFQKFRGQFDLRFGGTNAGVVWQDKEGRFALSPERIALRDALTGLLNQPFMHAARDRSLPDVAGHSVVVWDVPRLDQALALAEVRSRYVSDGLPAFSPAVRSGVERSLNRHFAQLIVDQVVEAASVQSMLPGQAFASDDAQAAAFYTARQRLLKLQTQLDELGAGMQADDLRALVSRDALERLRLVNEAFVQSELYQMRTREQQGGRSDRSPVLVAFGANDMATLQAYLVQQSDRTDALAKQAQVYLAALESGSKDSSLVMRWQGIGRDLERHRLKNPNSSLLQLEQFVLTSALDVDRGHCRALLSSPPPVVRPGDYFAERHGQIHSALLSRCTDWQLRDQQEQWQRFAVQFNQRVAGHPPFASAAGASGGITASANVATYAGTDPIDLAEVLKDFEPVYSAFKATRNDVVRPGATGQAVRRFVAQFEPVRDVLAPLFADGEEAAPGLDVHLELRSHTGAEIEGNKIIDWSFDVGDQSVRLREPAHALRWTPRMPVALVLRLAKDAPVKALPDPRQPAMSTDGHTVSFRFTDTWALLSLLNRQRDTDGAQRADGRSQLLKFEFPLQAQLASNKTAAPIALSTAAPTADRARVFVRVTLTAAGKKAALSWPATFPTRAPEWSSQR